MGNKTIFVTGGSGNQGGAAARSLLKNGFNVKILTRNPSSSKIQSLKSQGAEIIEGNLDQRETFQEALQNVDAIFCVLTYDYGTAKEIKQGLQIVDLARANNIGHFIYSSVIGSDIHSGIPHWESKFKIENHLKQSGLPFTILRPSSFYENFLLPPVKSRILKGVLSTPVKRDVLQQFVSAHDVGELSSVILMNPDPHLGKTITIAAEEMDMKQAATLFGEVLGKEVKYQPLPMFLTRLFMGKNNTIMFKWVNANNALFVKDLIAFKKEYPNLTGLKEWITMNFSV